ncbi:hypothetical protein ACP4OV_000538 [Aristida adscensionis]
MGHAPLPLLATLLAGALLATELHTFAYGGCSAMEADATAAAPEHGGAVPPAASGAGDAAVVAVYGESKRLVPQGSNPLHN